MPPPNSPNPPEKPPSVPGVRRVMHRAVTGARGAVPRYTRELLASVSEGLNGHAPIEPTAQIETFTHSSLAALWIGHATVLLHIGGVGGITILTDPVFSRRIGMRLGKLTLGLARIVPPALDIAHLPPIDLVLLSHAHFDHLDRPSLKRLVGSGGPVLRVGRIGGAGKATAPRHNEFRQPDAPAPARNAPVITATHTARLIPRGFGEITELAWTHSTKLTSKNGTHLTITALKPEHWGARTAYDRHRRFNSYLIESNHQPPLRILFAGDTAHTHAFDHLGPVDLAIFGIGAYNPWEHAHATPEQVWSMYTRLGAASEPTPTPRGHLLPMHHSTFILSREPVDEPLRRLKQVAGEAGAPHIIADMPGKMWAML